MEQKFLELEIQAATTLPLANKLEIIMSKTFRWYTKPDFFQIDYDTMVGIWMAAGDDNKNVDLPLPSDEEDKSTYWLVDPQAAEAVGVTPRIYYQVIVKKPISEISDQFDPEKFKDVGFVNMLKTEASKILSKNLTNLGDKLTDNPANYLTALLQNAYVPYNFHIDTGNPNAGSLISFQVLFSYGVKEKEAASEAQKQIAAAADAAKWAGVEFKRYKAFEFMSHHNNSNTMLLAENILKIVNEKNKALEEKYDINFEILSGELRSLHGNLYDKFYGSIAPSQVRYDLWDKYAALEEDKPPPSETTMVPLERVEFAFDQEVDLVRVMAYLEWGTPPTNPADMQTISETLINADQVNENYGDEVRHLIFNAESLRAYCLSKTNPASVDVDEFVNKFIRPIPQKLPASAEATAVQNDGEAVYKAGSDLATEMLTNEQKNAIHQEVLQSVNQVGDAAFLDAMQRAKNLKSLEELYENIIRSIPVDSIISTAATCLMKHMPEINLEAMVCEAILGELSFEQLDDLLGYFEEIATKDPNSPGAKLIEKIKKYPGEFTANVILGEEADDESATKKALRNSIQNIFRVDLEARDLICAAVFAAIPAAYKMLEALAKASFPLDPEFPEFPKIENPAVPIFDIFKGQLGKYKITTFTGDWSEMIKNLISNLVHDLVLKSITLLLEEIALLCEGSSKSDFANLDTDVNKLPNYPGAPVPVFPFDTNTVDEAVMDPAVYDDLSGFTGVSSDLIKDFLSELGNLLTLSEICVLLSLNESRTTANLDYIIDKVWVGLLSLEKFKPLKEALRNKGRLKQFFSILGKKTSKAHCVNKLKKLENTKKLLSDLCGPTSNKALIDDLKKKASDAAIQDLLNQENRLNKGIMDALSKLKDPKLPPIFCGPDSANNEKPPVFESQLHPSEEYLNNKILNNIMTGIQSAFEKDIGFYKPILTTGGTQGRVLAASKQVAGAMAKLYGDISGGEFALKDANENPIPTKDIAALNSIVSAGKIVAPGVYSALVNANLGIKVTSETDADFLQISTDNTVDGDDVINLKINFGEDTQNGVPGTTSRLEFGGGASSNVQSYDKQVQFSKTPGKIILELMNTIGPENTDLYSFAVGAIALLGTNGMDFYGLVLEQIIKEHAEYITTKNLFAKKNFDKIELVKKNICDDSLLYYQEILDDISNNSKLLQCRVDISSAPTAQEIAQINAFVELAIKTVVIREFLRSLLVFSSFGIDSLIPKNNLDESFYYQYIIDQIVKKLSSSSDLTFKNYIFNYSAPIYAAKQNKNRGDYGDNEVIQLTMLDIVKRQFTSVQKMFYDKNKDVLDQFGVLQTEITTDDQGSEEVLRNILARTNEDLGGANSGVLFLNPPDIIEFDLEDKVSIIPDGYYSKYNRLKNGGFFIEKGFEVLHKFEDDEGAFNIEDYNVMQSGLTSAAANDLVNALYSEEGNFRYVFGTSAGLIPWGINFNELAKFQIQTLLDLQQEGKISLTNGGKIIDAVKNFKSGLEDLWKTDSGAISGNKKQLLEKLFNEPNRFFKRLNYYMSLNLLIPVNSPIMEQKFNDIKSATSPDLYNSFFYKAVLDKKYFLREENSDLVYFKLPLLIFYDNKTSQESVPHADQTKNKTLSQLKLQFIGTNKWLTDRNTISDDSRFENFIELIEYKSLLSFLSILVAELIEKKYPQIQSMFDGTLDAIQAALDTFLTVANRDLDPDFYQKSSFDTQSAMASGVDINWVTVILEALIKSLANTTDPTWKTPWFFPGPLTPIGIIAKILDGSDDEGGSNATADTGSKLLEDIDCPDDSNS